jgi:hypothetical protein
MGSGKQKRKWSRKKRKKKGRIRQQVDETERGRIGKLWRRKKEHLPDCVGQGVVQPHTLYSKSGHGISYPNIPLRPPTDIYLHKGDWSPECMWCDALDLVLLFLVLPSFFKIETVSCWWLWSRWRMRKSNQDHCMVPTVDNNNKSNNKSKLFSVFRILDGE